MATRNDARTSKGDAYTLRQALKEAHEMLENEFGKTDQSAAVALANTLYGVHARDEFLRENDPESEMAYGGAGTPGGQPRGGR